MNNAISAQGSTLGVSTTPNNYILINQLADFTAGAGKASKLDASNLSSTQKEWIAGLIDRGELTIKGQRVHTDAGQNLLKSNQGNGVNLYFQATLPSGDQCTFIAQVAEFSVAASTDKVLEFTAVVWPTNLVWVA
ncbi:hypothetical protein SAMN04487785_102388 [Dyella jiangningensis]|uniref:phage tail tube protein n=1 Tax=Dyella sp. AtDHG13 TaxID=1938897 RepID=UPI0008915024|nr:phage tail tube protein [Dyella sp. AtDHG13]PXV60660.1 hypothetical protein BDW41_102387 [Dyella sp. AtDHG13]SDJ54144.1 hypothetical protein SAMN04487785_102388 [Dyella jiangningensis]